MFVLEGILFLEGILGRCWVGPRISFRKHQYCQAQSTRATTLAHRWVEDRSPGACYCRLCGCQPHKRGKLGCPTGISDLKCYFCVVSMGAWSSGLKRTGNGALLMQFNKEALKNLVSLSCSPKLHHSSFPSSLWQYQQTGEWDL